MKTWIMIIILAFFCGSVQAWELSIEPMYTIYTASDIKDGPGLKINLKHKGFYAWTSEERAIRQFRNLDCIRMALRGYGIGAEGEILNGLLLSADIGRFEPRVRTWPATLINDFPGFLLSLQDTGFHYFQYQINAGYGGSAGLSYRKSLSDKWILGLTVRYRFLTLYEVADGVDYYFHSEIPNNHWTEIGDKSFSGVQFGLSVGYRF